MSKRKFVSIIIYCLKQKCEDPLSPGLALPVPEPGDIDRAVTVHFDDVDGDLQKLQKELTGMKSYILGLS
jgi:formin 2